MPFADPAGGYFSPSMPSAGPQSDPNLTLKPLPNLQDINSPRDQPFRSVAPINYQPDKTAGTAIEGAGQLVNNAVNIADTVIKQNLTEQIRKGSDEIMNQQLQAGLDTKSDIQSNTSQGDPSRELPMGIAQGLGRMDTVQKAKRSGAMSDSQFYAQMQDLSSGLKSKYPGYSEVINQKLESMTGFNADKYRASLQADITQLRQDQVARQNKYDTFISQKGYLFPPGFDWKSHSFTELQWIAQQKESTNAQFDLDNKRIAHKLAQGSEVSSDAQQAAVSRATYDVTQRAQIGLAALEKSAGMPIAQFIAEGGKDPKVVQAFVGGIQQLELAANNHIDAIFNSTVGDQPSMPTTTTTGDGPMAGGNTPVITGNSIASMINDPAKMDAIRATALKPLTTLRSLIENQQYGPAGYLARNLQQVKDLGESNFLTKYPEAIDIGEMAKRFGPAFGAFFFNSPRGAAWAGGMVNEALRHKSIMNSSWLSDDAKEVENNKDANFKAGNWQAFISDKTQALITPGVDPKLQEQVARKIFLDPDGGSVLSKVSPEQRMGVFTQLASPQVAAAIEKMPSEVKEGYFNYVKENFSLASKRLGDEIVAQDKASPYFQVKLEPTTMHFIPVPTEEGAKLGQGSFERSIKSVQSSLTQLNAGIDILKPVVDQSGDSISRYVGSLALGLHIDPKSFETKDAVETERTRDATNKMMSNPQNKAFYDSEKAGSKGPDNLREMILQGESGGNFNNVHPSMSRIMGPMKPTNMTIDEVLAAQDKARKLGAESTAIGGPQFINSTLQGLVKEMGLKGTDKFDEPTQRAMMERLLERRGYSKFKSGKMSANDFADSLANEWAALPNTKTGKSTYEGIAGNRNQVSLPDFITMLQKEGGGPAPAMNSKDHAKWRADNGF